MLSEINIELFTFCLTCVAIKLNKKNKTYIFHYKFAPSNELKNGKPNQN